MADAKKQLTPDEELKDLAERLVKASAEVDAANAVAKEADQKAATAIRAYNDLVLNCRKFVGPKCPQKFVLVGDKLVNIRESNVSVETVIK